MYVQAEECLSTMRMDSSHGPGRVTPDRLGSDDMAGTAQAGALLALPGRNEYFTDRTCSSGEKETPQTSPDPTSHTSGLPSSVPMLGGLSRLSKTLTDS